MSCQVALLLMSWSADDNSKDAIYWSGVAINQARLLNEHKDEIGISPNSSDVKLRHRLWWLVLMKEADASLSLSALPRISHEGMRILDHDDFDFVYPIVDDKEFTTLKLKKMQTILKESLETLCIQKAKLSFILHQILSELNVPAPRGKAFVSISPRVWHFSFELENWYKNFPSSPVPVRSLSRTIPRARQHPRSQPIGRRLDLLARHGHAAEDRDRCPWLDAIR